MLVIVYLPEMSASSLSREQPRKLLPRSGAKVYSKLGDDELNLIASNLRAHGSARRPRSTALRHHRARRRTRTVGRARRRRFPAGARRVIWRARVARAAVQAGRAPALVLLALRVWRARRFRAGPRCVNQLPSPHRVVGGRRDRANERASVLPPRAQKQAAAAVQ